ncbi:hypothetical protein L0337_22015 [candidate division KSB1 bacterium]|nr:hypothetical protein [candidate division KSB1 bacterium]
MNTIEILQEQANAEGAAYRARCRDWEAVGATPGAALDAIERLVAASSGDGNGTVVIVQRFRPDAFFTGQQQVRLQELMERFHAALAAGKELALEERKELEALVDAEWQAAIDRAAEILRASQSSQRAGQRA